jgi:hypothetical protein
MTTDYTIDGSHSTVSGRSLLDVLACVGASMATDQPFALPVASSGDPSLLPELTAQQAAAVLDDLRTADVTRLDYCAVDLLRGQGQMGLLSDRVRRIARRATAADVIAWPAHHLPSVIGGAVSLRLENNHVSDVPAAFRANGSTPVDRHTHVGRSALAVYALMHMEPAALVAPPRPCACRRPAPPAIEAVLAHERKRALQDARADDRMRAQAARRGEIEGRKTVFAPGRLAAVPPTNAISGPVAWPVPLAPMSADQWTRALYDVSWEGMMWVTAEIGWNARTLVIRHRRDDLVPPEAEGPPAPPPRTERARTARDREVAGLWPLPRDEEDDAYDAALAAWQAEMGRRGAMSMLYAGPRR